MTKPIPKVYATRFFQLVTSRQFAEAERILERVKQKMHVSERNRGYFQALSGMLLAQKSNDDRYAFMFSIDLTDKKQLKNYRQEFLSHAKHRLHAEYDRGFFEAWTDYMKILPRLDLPSSSVINKSVAEPGKKAQTKNGAKAIEEMTSKTRGAGEEKHEQENEVEIERKEKSVKGRTEEESVERTQRTLSDFAK